MNTIKSPCNTIIKFTILLYAVLSFTVFGAKPASEFDRLVGRQSYLSQKIDSLDLVKQELKRNGTVISELEEHQKNLRDSLLMIRQRINRISATTPSVIGKKSIYRFLQKPSNIFDWIILIVGLVALFSGVMLAMGFFRTLTSKRVRPKRKRTGDKPAQTVPVSPTPRKPEQPVAAYPHYASTPAHPQPSTSITNTSLVRLKKRLDQHETTPPTDPPPIPEPPSVPSSPPEENHTTSDIEQQVIAAAGEGFDIQTLSKRFHLSVDHITLLLKVAGNTTRRN